MKKLFIIKIGTTFAGTLKRFGDFDRWTKDTLGTMDSDICVLDVAHGAALPPVADCAGVVVTGSHAMVTDRLPWSLRVASWIPSLLEARVPLLGICYGHQLLAQSMGGRVGFHPGGMEIGTVEVHLLPACAGDDLFRLLPQRLCAHVTHSQTVLRLPPGATRLAANTHEPNHAFRVGECAWGVQFHPEYDAGIMRSYIREQKEALGSMGANIPALLRTVRDTPAAARILGNFARIVQSGMVNRTDAGGFCQTD